MTILKCAMLALALAMAVTPAMASFGDGILENPDPNQQQKLTAKK